MDNVTSLAGAGVAFGAFVAGALVVGVDAGWQPAKATPAAAKEAAFRKSRRFIGLSYISFSPFDSVNMGY
jgi:hypothetical protein